MDHRLIVMAGIGADMFDSPSGSFGSIIAHREESRIPSIQESHPRGSRSRFITGGRGPSRRGRGRQFSHSVAGLLTTGRISAVATVTARLRLPSIWSMAGATRVRLTQPRLHEIETDHLQTAEARLAGLVHHGDCDGWCRLWNVFCRKGSSQKTYHRTSEANHRISVIFPR